MKEKIVFWLVLNKEEGHRRAVVIEESGNAAKWRATFMDPYRDDWKNAEVSVIARVSHTRTVQVLAMDEM